MTVGELVQTEMTLDLVDNIVAGGGEMRSVLSILCSLGIWDAEVLDCEFDGFKVRQKGDPTFDGLPVFWDPDAWFWTQLAQGRTKGAFRLIVLPLQGDEPLRPWSSGEKERSLTECIEKEKK